MMVGETGLGSVRIGQALGNELAGFLVVPQIMEHCQVDKPVHPPLGEPWPDMGWPVALGMAFAMALVMAFAMALVIMAFAMALVMAFAMALASSAVTWCSDLSQNNVVMKKSSGLFENQAIGQYTSLGQWCNSSKAGDGWALMAQEMPK